MGADTFDLRRWPALEKNVRVRTWFTIQANLCLAPRTLLAYARGLADFLLVCDDDRLADVPTPAGPARRALGPCMGTQASP